MKIPRINLRMGSRHYIDVMHARLCGALLALCLIATPLVADITGTVMNGDGTPIAGARVIIRASETVEARRARLLSEVPDPATLASTQTDAKGAFRLESPKQAVVSLHVLANGYGPESGRVERDEEVGAIVLRKGAAGRGTITSGDGKPVANATVVVQYNDQLEYIARTNEEGRYEAPDPKRAIAIAVLHPDHAIDEKTPSGSPFTERDLTRTLAAGKKLTGVVTGPDGRTPVANATLAIDNWPLAKSGEDGTFTIPRAPSRWSTLTARGEGMIGQAPFAKTDAYKLRLGKPAVLSGRVTNAKTKVPVAGAIVRAALAPMNRGEGFRAETDAKGVYSIAVPPGSYLLFTSHPGYTAADGDVSVAAGQAAARDLTVAQLARVSGTVVDEEKRPVVAANIASMDSDPGRQGPMMRSSDTVYSGPDGRFSTRVAPDVPLLITATKRGLTAKSEQVRVGAGERKTGVMLTLPSGIAVGGRVTDKNGDPLSGVAVVPMPPDDDGNGMYRMMMPGARQTDDDAVRTGSDGTFTLRVAEGKYDFSFRREGYAPKLVRGQSITRLAPAAVDATMEPASEIAGRVVRGGNGVEGVSVTAFGPESYGAAVTGPDGSFAISGLAAGNMRVTLRKESDFIQEMRTFTAPARDALIELPGGGRVTGRVVDKATGKPLTSFQAGISVPRNIGGMSTMAPPQMREFNSEDGTFSLESVPPGAMFLVASAPGYATARLNVTIEEGKTVSDVELAVDPGVHLTGRVTGPDGTPLPDVSVRVDTSASSGFTTWGPESTALTDANGEYSLETLPAGEGTVAFMHANYVASRRQVTLKGRETKLDVQLSAGQRVTGVVVTEAGAPVPDAQVAAHGAGMRGGSARTNADGTFEMESISPGRYRFTATKAGVGNGSVDDVDVSGRQQVRITMHAGATIYGRIIGLPPEELALAKVEAWGQQSSASGRADSSGNYRLEGAPTGNVEVYAEVESNGLGPERASQIRMIEVEPGSSENVDLTFRTDITIRGRVVRDGKPLPSAYLTFESRSASAQTFARATTNEQGMYSLNGVEEGEYNVQVTDMRLRVPYSTTYTVRGSGTFDIEFRTGSVRGTVIDAATSEPLANATVQLRPSVQPASYSMPHGVSTDNAGNFVVELIPPGSYVVTSSKDGYTSDVRTLPVGERGEELQVKLARGDGVALKTVDGRNGQPVSALIWVYDAQNHVVYEPPRIFSHRSDDGEVKLPLAPGSYTAFVTVNGYAGVNLRIQSPSPAVVVALTPGGTILVKSKHSEGRRIRLIDASGIPYDRWGNALPLRELLPQPGTTQLLHIASGTYTLQLLGDGETVVDSMQVTVQEGRVVEAEI
jgi:uncharacterized GH25 family protein